MGYASAMTMLLLLVALDGHASRSFAARGSGSSTQAPAVTTVHTAIGAKALERRKLQRACGGGVLIAVVDHSLLIAVSHVPCAVRLRRSTALMTDEQSLSPDLWPEPFQWDNLVYVFHTPGRLWWHA